MVIKAIICNAGCATLRPLNGCSKCAINVVPTEYPVIVGADTTIRNGDVTKDRDFTVNFEDEKTSEIAETTDDQTTMEIPNVTTNFPMSTEPNTIPTYQTTIPPAEVTSDSNTNVDQDDTTTEIPITTPKTTIKTPTPPTTTTVKPTPDWSEVCQELCRVGDGGKLCNCDLPPFF